MLRLKSPFINIVRNLTSIPRKCLVYNQNGEPEDVLHEIEDCINFDENSSDVHVKFIASVIHPSNINTIQGVYPAQPPLPAVPGSEGVAKVVSVGSKVTSLSPGDHVTIGNFSNGTWCTDSVLPAEHLDKVDQQLDPFAAVVMRANPCSAFRMLSDFVKDLKPGDTVVQTGSTSAVGIYAIQLARLRGLRTVNVIRKRETSEATDQTRSVLREFGADVVVTEEEMRMDSAGLGPARLALNCVGGKPALSLLKVLDKKGVMVSYGAMNRLPLHVPVGPLIFKDISLCGFWFSRWSNENQGKPESTAMISEIQDLFLTGKLKPSPYEAVDFKDWRRAIKQASFKDSAPPPITKKQILVMSST